MSGVDPAPNLPPGDWQSRQTALEELLAHQQHTIDALNEAVTQHRQELTAWGLKVQQLEAKVRALALQVERSGDDLPDEPPPHY